MKRLFMMLGVSTAFGVACFAQSSPGVDTMMMPNLIEINVGAIKAVKCEALKVVTIAPTPRYSRDEVIARVELCEQQASELYGKINNYRSVLRNSKKKDLILKTTGYFRPTVLQGVASVHTDATMLYKNVNQEIKNIQASVISEREQQDYITRLENIKSGVREESQKIADLMVKKLKM